MRWVELPRGKADGTAFNQASYRERVKACAGVPSAGIGGGPLRGSPEPRGKDVPGPERVLQKEKKCYPEGRSRLGLMVAPGIRDPGEEPDDRRR